VSENPATAVCQACMAIGVGCLLCLSCRREDFNKANDEEVCMKIFSNYQQYLIESKNKAMSVKSDNG